MADRCTLAILSVVLIVAGCETTVNPQFRSCINQCVTDHNACIAEATVAYELESCNMEVHSCSSSCEKDHELYIEGASGIDHAEEAPSLGEATAR